MKQIPANGVLRLLMAVGVLVALYVAATVWKVRKQAENQQAEILQALHLYDSLATERLLKVAKQVHPNAKINVKQISSDTVKKALELSGVIRKAGK